MPRAETLTSRDLRKVPDHVATRPHASRNRMLLLTHWAGMRVGEVAALLVGAVPKTDGAVKREIRLDAEQTKGKHAHRVFVSERLHKEIAAYVTRLPRQEPDTALFAPKSATASQPTPCAKRSARSIVAPAATEPALTAAGVASSPRLPAKARECACWPRWQATRASRPLSAIGT